MKLLLDKHAIGERIKQIRGATSLSEYATRYEVARQTVYNWQDGVNVPELDTLWPRWRWTPMCAWIGCCSGCRRSSVHPRMMANRSPTLSV